MVSVNVLVGELLTGRITATIDATGCRWADTLNAAGSVDGVTVTDDVIRGLDLRSISDGGRSFLAFERDNRIKQGGPIWSRPYDWESGVVTLGAGGLWSYFDQRIVRPAGAVPPYQPLKFTVADKSLGGIARALVERAIGELYGDVPVVLPADEAGIHTETFPLWKLLRTGEQLKQITQRATDAPDIRFQPRRRADDPRFIEWVMQVGTEAKPSLSQAGPDWVFDTTAPKTSVIGIAPDEDATQMASQAWVTGNGQEENILMAVDSDPTLLILGWPLLESDKSFSTVEEQATLDGHAANLVRQRARPVEVYKMVVQADAAKEVLPGDYVRLVTKRDGSVKGSAWVGDMDQRMRVWQVSGDMTDRVTLQMLALDGLS